MRLELYKGNLINAGLWSPYSLYREDIATFAAGGDYKPVSYTHLPQEWVCVKYEIQAL